MPFRVPMLDSVMCTSNNPYWRTPSFKKCFAASVKNSALVTQEQLKSEIVGLSWCDFIPEFYTMRILKNICTTFHWYFYTCSDLSKQQRYKGQTYTKSCFRYLLFCVLSVVLFVVKVITFHDNNDGFSLCISKRTRAILKIIHW